MFSLETPTADVNNVNSLRSLLRARDAKIQFQQEMLLEKDEVMSALRHDLDGIQSRHLEEVQTLQLQINEMEQQHGMMVDRLSAMERDFNDKWTLQQYAGLISELSSSKKDKDQCIKLLEAKLCKALHEREVWGNQMTILKNSCSEAVKSFQEENIQLATQKFKLEVQLRNHLLAAEAEKLSMEHEYDALLRAQRQTIQKLENDLNYVALPCRPRSVSSRSTSSTSLMTPSCFSRSGVGVLRSHSHDQLIISLPTNLEDDEATQDSKVTLDIQTQSDELLEEQQPTVNEKATENSRPNNNKRTTPFKRDLSFKRATSLLLFRESRKINPEPLKEQQSLEDTSNSSHSSAKEEHGSDESDPKHQEPCEMKEDSSAKTTTTTTTNTAPRWQEIWEMEPANEILTCRRRIGSTDTMFSLVEAELNNKESAAIKTKRPSQKLLRCWEDDVDDSIGIVEAKEKEEVSSLSPQGEGEEEENDTSSAPPALEKDDCMIIPVQSYSC